MSKQSEWSKPASRPLPPEKTKLSGSDFEAIREHIAPDKWSDADLKLIWQRCVPADAHIEDLIYFLYVCDMRRLNPLLQEAYLRMQFNRTTGKKEPIIIVGIGGALKNANESGLLDGLKVDIAEADGQIHTATCTIWKKGAAHPFEATIYYQEYVGTDSGGKVTYMWATKGHMMISKCVIMSCLRIAFADILGGLYVQEEFAQQREPDSTFIVESTDSTSDTQTLPVKVEKPSVDNTKMPPYPVWGAPIDTTHTEYNAPNLNPMAAASAAKNIVAVSPAPAAKQDSEPSPRQQLLAMKQRILLDLSIPALKRKSILEQYFMGFLEINDVLMLPKDSELYLPSLQMLDHLALTRPTTSADLQEDAQALGIYAKSIYDQWFLGFPFPFNVATLAARLAGKFEFDSPEDLEKYLRANGVALSDQGEVAAFLRLALLDRTLAKDAGIRAAAAVAPVENVLMALESALGGPLETFSLADIRKAFDAI